MSLNQRSGKGGNAHRDRASVSIGTNRLLAGGNFGDIRLYRDVVKQNLVWAGLPSPLVEKSKGKLLICFCREDLKGRLLSMKACLVGRVVGDKPSALALHLWGKRTWKIEGELQVKSMAKGLFLF